MVQDVAEEGWFWMLGKLRQTLQSQQCLQGTWQSASSIAQGLSWVVACHSDAGSQGALEITSIL